MATKLHTPMGCGLATELLIPTREQLKKMLVEEQTALIKEIKPKRDPNDHYEREFYPEKEEMSHPPQPKLWYLIVVLKKAGISLEQVGDEMGLRFLGNVIHQFKLSNSVAGGGSCNYVCFLYNYFHKVSRNDWPAKNTILEKLTKSLPKMKQTRNKAEKSFNKWWREEMLKQIIYYQYRVLP